MSEINKWYNGKNVLITGATGFIGKCLTEKLLRSNHDIGDIYVMIRGTKSESFQQRKHNFFNHIVFKKLHDEKPHLLKKVKCIESDLLKNDLNLNDNDRKLLCDNVQIIFHSAADVRFDKPLVEAFETNVLGTRRMLDLAESVKNLDVSVFYLNFSKFLFLMNEMDFILFFLMRERCLYLYRQRFLKHMTLFWRKYHTSPQYHRY